MVAVQFIVRRLGRVLGTGAVAAVLVVGLGLLGGCSTMKPGSMAAVQPLSTEPRAGNVYLLRGFIGFWSAGINHLTDELNASGVRAQAYQDDQWVQLAATIKARYVGNAHAEPLVLIGHSYGADDALRVAQQLNAVNVPVDLLVTLDPVTPPQVPPNVRVCLNLYQSHGYWDIMPFFRGVPLSPAQGSTALILNGDVRGNRSDLMEPGLDHFNIEKKQKIHVEIIKTVLEACPARSVWAQSQHEPAAPPQASGAANSTIVVTDLSGAPSHPAATPPSGPVGESAPAHALAQGNATPTAYHAH